MSTDTRTSVMLVDDHQVMRDLLRDALENTGEFQVVAQAADGQEALRLVEEAAPDVIVMDVIMPVMDGIEACREITELLPGTRVLMLTAQPVGFLEARIPSREGLEFLCATLMHGSITSTPARRLRPGTPSGFGETSRMGQDRWQD